MPYSIVPPRDRTKKVKNIKNSGNMTLDEIVDIARTMKSKLLAKELPGCINEILGAAQSFGCTVDGQPPHDIVDGINSESGLGDVEIPSQYLNLLYARPSLESRIPVMVVRHRSRPDLSLGRCLHRVQTSILVRI